MFVLHAEKTKLARMDREQMTSGSVGVYLVRFEFSSDWVGLDKTAVFKAGDVSIPILLDDTEECIIPWEVTAESGVQVEAGVYGTLGDDVILPTIWCNLGVVMEGTSIPGDSGEIPPTPEIWQQELAQKGDRLDYTPNGDLGLYAGGKLLSALQIISGGSEESGTTDHRQLNHRDGEDQHPMKAITGLEDALRHIPEPMTAEELQNILNGGNQNVEHP